MGHAVNLHQLEATTREAAMSEGFDYACEWAEMNVDPYEDPSRSYHGDFKFYDKEFDTEEEAWEFFNNLGAYCDGIVRIKTVTASQRAKAQEKLNKLEERRNKLENDVIDSFRHRKSQTIKCKECGVVMPNDVACDGTHMPRCCNCGTLLLPDGVKKRFDTIDSAIADVRNHPPVGNGKAAYFAKVEVHC